MSLRLVYRKTRARGKRKTGSGTYYIEGTDHTGQRVHDSLHTGDRDLANREFAKRVAKTLEARKHGAKAIMNFADAYEVYKEAKGVNTNTQWLDVMLPKIGARKLSELTQADLNKLAKDLYPGCAPSTLKRQVYVPFLAAYNSCVDHEPPLADPKRWKSPRVKRKAVDSPDDGYIEALIAAARMPARAPGQRPGKGSLLPERNVAAVLFITLTGCRSGEAQRVRIRDVDLDRGFVLLRKTKAKGQDKPRQVALAPALVNALRAYIATLGNPPGDALLFKWKSRFGLPQMVTRVRKRAGLPHYRPHQIGRHAFATRLLHEGASLLDVQIAGGWDDAKMVAETYGHLSQQHVDRIVAGQALKPKPTKRRDSA